MGGSEVTIKRCSECYQLIDDRRVSQSGIIFSLWTDGKTNSGTKNITGGRDSGDRYLVKCPHCLSNVWFFCLDIDSTASIMWGTEDRLETSTPFSTPKFNDYHGELRDGTIATEFEKSYRHVMWWSGNDKRRDIRKKKPLCNSEAKNLQALAEMLDCAIDHERLALAEIKRELGLFDDATELLLEPFSRNEIEEHRTFIQKLVDKKDSTVRAYTYK